MCTFFRNFFVRCFNWCCCSSKCQTDENQRAARADFEMVPNIIINNIAVEAGATGTDPSTSTARLLPKVDNESKCVKPMGVRDICDLRNPKGNLQLATKTIYRRPAGTINLSPPSRPWYDTNTNM